MTDSENNPRLYRDLADWWPVLSAPEDYAEEAEFYRSVIMSEATIPPRTLLELGCGGGNSASHLKKHFDMTLLDMSPGMLDVSRCLNPECEHVLGDMREVRLGRQFDAVFIHDAINYMATQTDLGKAISTAYEHCRPDGVVLLAPDFTRETFRSMTSHGGHDLGQRSLRYLSWMPDPDPGDSTYITEMVYLMRDEQGVVSCVHDRHISGLFGREVWIKLMTDSGFMARAVPCAHGEFDGLTTDVFVGRKR